MNKEEWILYFDSQIESAKKEIKIARNLILIGTSMMVYGALTAIITKGGEKIVSDSVGTPEIIVPFVLGGLFAIIGLKNRASSSANLAVFVEQRDVLGDSYPEG